ncbi:2-polyprenyl-3-methyl-5-hydroxy-6-metoxy-1,4-benzoquinol methylase [Paramagnetospirillum caucaseum]|uniref:2-polyprenyl-3-methyl-5-hydroxy-6-metoxy-1, 4-benzoquinol methylase n=1 Tax=Paramagnetospirillum caucaseum TaxID=1244869 RepID=M2ZPB4_9PROT|nr:methyltransferase domain-containing protein [Paramagnetospirillum caucaseum]EME69132.1 2-polyprenyl-3-methyl-5-hydroxy-6-metoxy-1,4-benzoquinol methylase [Paramagnetospirillum caucaseum]
MVPWLLDLLVCPTCAHQPALALTEAEERDGEIVAGTLSCPDCRQSWPIRGGIPRFVAADQDYCDNFGFQWKHWKAVQIDRLSGHDLSERRFMTDSGWAPDWIKDRLILDCGCGAGRFTDVVAQKGGRVVACDLSQAIESCHETTRVHEGRVACIQASLFELPLRRESFDGLFCMGVIQHTPDPAAVMRALPAFLAPGGALAYNFYEADFWPKLQPLKYALRLLTPHLSTSATLKLSETLVRLLFPLSHALSGIPKIRLINHVLPICATHDPRLDREQQFVWTLLDTFDWYGPRYENRQKHRDVGYLLRAGGLDVVECRPGIVNARKAQP